MPDVEDPWWWKAACRGMAPMFDRPTFRSNDAERSRRKFEAWHLACARVCITCPVAEQCYDDHIPGRDEGVRAGVVLPPVDPLHKARAIDRAKHGTAQGARMHYRLGEKPCDACRIAGNEANRRLHAARRERGA